VDIGALISGATIPAMPRVATVCPRHRVGNGLKGYVKSDGATEDFHRRPDMVCWSRAAVMCFYQLSRRLPLVLAALSQLPVAAAAIHVDSTADGIGDGSSWENAFPSLQAALASAPTGAEIWVAAGTYYPDDGPGLTAGNPAHTFHPGQGVKLYGGFAGNETLAAQRDPKRNRTILSGDIGRDDLDPDGDGVRSNPDEIQGTNAWHILSCGLAAEGPQAIDGFIVTGGDGLAVGFDEGFGSALMTNRSSVQVSRCIFSGNRSHDGGAVYIEGGSPSFSECRFAGNRAGIAGAVLNMYGAPAIDRCVFTGNAASNSDGTGGALINYSSKGVVTSYVISQCEFSGNAAYQGGAVVNSGFTNPTYINCTFVGNDAAAFGGAVSNGEVTVPTFVNCILAGNRQAGSSAGPGASIWNLTTYNLPSFRHCLVAGSGGSFGWNSMIGINLGNNLDSDPKFVAAPSTAPAIGGDCRLLLESPAINSGLNQVVASAVDLAGRARIQGGTVDMGAYEGGHMDYWHTFPGLDPDGDANGNGRSNFLDYISGANPLTTHESSTNPTVAKVGENWQYRFTIRPDVLEAGYTLQVSGDLVTWDDLEAEADFEVLPLEVVNQARHLVTLKLAADFGNLEPRYWRLIFRDP
jgi:hypothetical protein